MLKNPTSATSSFLAQGKGKTIPLTATAVPVQAADRLFDPGLVRLMGAVSRNNTREAGLSHQYSPYTGDVVFA
jgi:hypothetical protein